RGGRRARGLQREGAPSRRRNRYLHPFAKAGLRMAAARRSIYARKAQLAFDAVSIEGGLLSPEWLSKIAQLGAGAQSEADYRIPKGLNLRDEIGRYWRIAQAYWQEFATGLAGKGDAKKLAERFVTDLLRESFGFASLSDVDAVMLGGRAYPIGH